MKNIDKKKRKKKLVKGLMSLINTIIIVGRKGILNCNIGVQVGDI